MRGFLMRVWFVILGLCSAIASYLCFAIAKPELFWFLTPETAEWFSVSIREPVVFALCGTVIALISGVIFLLISTCGGFSRKIVKPKEVDRMIAQGKAVYLVDKKVYVTENTHLYNLKDLNRIRKLYKFNLFYIRIYDELAVEEEASPAHVEVTNLLEDDKFQGNKQKLMETYDD